MKKQVLLLTVLAGCLVLTVCSNIEIVNAQKAVYIRPDGSVEGTNNIRRDGDVYTFTGTVERELTILKSSIVVDGAGNALQGKGTGIGIDLSNGRGQDPTRTRIENVTIKNIQIVDFRIGINLVNSKNNSIIGNYISDYSQCGINMGGGDFLIKHNTIENPPGREVGSIVIHFAVSGEIIITENNFINPAIQYYLSLGTTFDRNYWKEYNVPDENWDGIGDIPYTVFERDLVKLVDEHPLKSPVEMAVIPEFPTVAVVAFFVVCSLFVFYNRVKLQKLENT